MRVSARFLLILLAALIFLALPSFATFYTDWLWFVETGYETVFTRTLTAQAATGLVTALVAFAVLTLNTRLAVAFLAQPYVVLGAS